MSGCWLHVGTHMRDLVVTEYMVFETLFMDDETISYMYEDCLFGGATIYIYIHISFATLYTL